MAQHNKTATNKELVVGVGSALMDILTHEDDDFLERTGALKGGMRYVDWQFIEAALTKASRQPRIVPGGSACNTVVGVGKLGGAARFVGKCGNGRWGNRFCEDLVRQNVEPVLLRSDSPTGRVLSIITPDAQRSMFTFLGASAETTPEELDSGCFHGAAIVHIEGYLLFNPDLITVALQAAKSAGALVSLDLASFTVVEGSRDLLEQFLDQYVDIVMANEDEARAFTGSTDETEALQILAEKTDIAVLKVGQRGSYISRDGKIWKVDAIGDGRAVDTTGAGDLWASGFLYGLVKGLPLDRCGRIASACGYEVCQVVGASIPSDGWDRIRKLVVSETSAK